MDWEAVEDTLGMRLPRDYKQLAALYGPGAFCGFIRLYHPHAPTEWVSITGPMPATIREQLQHARDHGTYPVPYEPGSLFAIGVTDNGEYLFWVTDPRTEPDSWHIAVNEARGPGWYHFEGTLTHFLTSVLSGRTKVPLFPDDLLANGAAFAPTTAAPGNRRPEPRPTAGPIDPKAVRAWARANGHHLPDRGRIPAAILTEWEQSTGR
ncbi:MULTISPECIES: histone-like nucleoid-structuring protein Lsr2 [unclassified Streptomyces]|uniref:Lsr2 family DNA-binding protein n=1 Tax=unclassified Streptomyces TaxID=2593676 RepID=UPI00380EBAE6